MFFLLFIYFTSIFESQGKFSYLKIEKNDHIEGTKPIIVKMDLNLPPYKRFKKAFTQSQLDCFRDIQRQFFRKYIVFIPIFRSLENILSLTYDEEFNDEIIAWANVTRVSVKRILVWNYFYELLHMCISMVIQTPLGKIIHFRNLDYPFTDLVAQIFFQGHYYKNGELIFKGDVILGLSLIMTAMKKDAFAFSINDRNFRPIIQSAIIIASTSRPPIGWYMRKLMEDCDTFWCAYETIKEDEFEARVYITLSGVNKDEGVIIEKNEYSIDDEIWLMDFLNVNYIQVTNQDRDRLPKHVCDTRRASLLALIQIHGEKSLHTYESLKKYYMKNYPLFYILSLYNVLMSAGDDHYDQIFWQNVNAY